MSSTIGSSDLKKFGKGSLNFEDLLDKKEVLDIFFILFCAIFSITIIYQFQFLQSSDAALSDLGLISLGREYLSFIGAVMGLLLSNAEFIKFKNPHVLNNFLFVKSVLYI